MIRLLAALALLLVAAPALADEMRPVSIRFEQVDDAHWSLGWRQPVSGAVAVRSAVPQLPSRCRLDGAIRREIAPLAVVGHADVLCLGEVAGQAMGWREFPGGGEAILRVTPQGRPVQVHRLTPEAPLAIIAAKPSAAQVWRSYFVIGVEHILTGWDHLLFVIALVLLVARPWPAAKAATAFTLAHSLTLAAVTLGFAGLPQRPVEVLIALSIVFLAAELARGNRDTLTRRLPWAVAFIFGLVHGFGFAGALREIGLPEGEVPAALVSFNLGVEAGQLMVISAILLVIAGLRRLRPSMEPQVLRLAAYAIGITGAYWLVDRALG